MEDALHHKSDVTGELPLSEQEKEILDMYDEVQKLELEVALTRARVRLANENVKGAGKRAATSDDQESQDIKDAREQLLEAIALHNLRQSVVTNVLMTNPILKGIHNSTYASPIEQDLHPWVQTRDATAHSVATQSAVLRRTLDQLSEVEADTLRTSRRNRELASEVLRLAKEADVNRNQALDADEGAKVKIAELEEKLAKSRQKWRVFKGTASGIVAGSEVDWVSDEELRAVVLDPE
ncbi:hypothetical protein N0V93_003496 [Gnomoniopsis smithogilvyi]|uniref:Centromere protein H C-terminal domain-containing protein n=1 Tax=Gnomoniopsis smithogilvyi TaxID=1191159 RepID=A0A9W8YWT0_9PEZI|nr:hypothetical protein N0V93_003496 [Gnomoniopsis smithogilvyi]